MGILTAVHVFLVIYILGDSVQSLSPFISVFSINLNFSMRQYGTAIKTIGIVQ